MSIFKSIFKKKEPKSGVFIIKGNTLEELENLPGSGSINELIESLGFKKEEIFTVFLFDSKKIQTAGVKVFTKKPVFAILNEGQSGLTYSQLISELNKIDWRFEYSHSQIESILDDGISNQSLSLEFLSSVLKLDIKENGMCYSPSLKLLLIFENNLLVQYLSGDGYNSAARWVKDLNQDLFENILSIAKKHQPSLSEAIKELNIQCDSLQSLPGGINNEFLPEYLNESGGFNFFNTLISKYKPNSPLDEFIFMNKGRFVKLSETEYSVGKFIYSFNSSGELVDSWRA